MKNAENLQISSSLPEAELNVALSWLTKALTDFEARETSFSKEYFEDNASFQLGEAGTLVGLKAMQECSEWIHNGITRWSLVLKSAHFVPNQIVFVVGGTAALAKGTAMPLDWVVTVDMAPQSNKVRGAKIFGEVAPLLTRVVGIAGPVKGLTPPAA